ncbi:MAG: hypothetical protein KBS64_06560 [Treponema sp.]|nr:hypothetical protein [Candidatus Treponema equi]
MKKIFNVLTVLLFVLLAGCKTAKVEEPVETDVHPLALLSDDLSIYMSVPVKEYEPLVTKIVCSIMDGIKEADAKAICERTDVLYSGLGTLKDRSHLETASLTSVPKIAVNSIMTKKNGFEKTKVTFDDKELVKFKSEKSPFEVAFPSTKMLCFSQNIDPLLQRFANEEEVKDTAYNQWVGQSSSDILFYITRPGQYLRSLIGQTVNVGADHIYGNLKYRPDPKKPGQYSGRYTLNFYIHLSNKKAASALRALLSLSFSMLGGQVDQTDADTLYLSDIEVTEKQIIELFTRDPITGKHYRVVGEEVIEESVKKK